VRVTSSRFSGFSSHFGAFAATYKEESQSEGDRVVRFPSFHLGRSLLRAAFLPFFSVASLGSVPEQDAPPHSGRGVRARRGTLCGRISV
jgi:hypothetical protein